MHSEVSIAVLVEANCLQYISIEFMFMFAYYNIIYNKYKITSLRHAPRYTS